MKKELEWFSIDGSFGGDQDRMNNIWMKIGGCAALAAVDSCIAFTLHKGLSDICPIDLSAPDWESYNRFAETIRPYLSPRIMGVNKLCYYTDGFGAYLRDVGCRSLTMNTLPMGTPVNKARESIKAQIDAGFPVPILHLNPKNRRVKDYRWHWFMLVGYEGEDADFTVTVATYGQKSRLKLDDLWNEEDADNGGLILYGMSSPVSANETVIKTSALIFDCADGPHKVLALRQEGGLTVPRFPICSDDVKNDSAILLTLEPGEGPSLAVKVQGLMMVHEYDDAQSHVSERIYKAVLSDDEQPVLHTEAGNLIWITESEAETAEWLPCDLSLLNIIRSELADIEAIQKRIAEEEAKAAEEINAR